MHTHPNHHGAPPQVYDFVDGVGGCIYIATPQPPTIPIATLLSRAVSTALDLPICLPLDSLFAAAAASNVGDVQVCAWDWVGGQVSMLVGGGDVVWMVLCTCVCTYEIVHMFLLDPNTYTH